MLKNLEKVISSPDMMVCDWRKKKTKNQKKLLFIQANENRGLEELEFMLLRDFWKSTALRKAAGL